MPGPPRAPQPRVAATLAGVGGWVDAVGFLTLFGLFTAHLSGNTARLGVELGQGEVSLALTYLVPILVFIGGVAAGSWYMAAHRDRNTLPPLLAVEALLVTTFMVVGTSLRDAGDLTPRSAAYYGLAVLATAAMGLQTSSLRHVCDVEVHTTFVTGMITSFAEELVASARHEPDAPRRARIHGGLVASYLVGAVCGSALDTSWRLWSLAIPVVVLGALSVGMRRPGPVSATP
ncbi:MAG TPA: YoaK family protein [Acidimicrobiia bacterium]